MRRVSVAEAIELLSAGGFVYLDVRTVPEFDTGHVAGAYNVPWHEPGSDGSRENPDFIDEVCAVLARGQGLVVGCAAGVRSLAAAELLEAYGFIRVCELLAGTEGQRDPFGRVREAGLREAGVPLVTHTATGRSHAEIRATRSALRTAPCVATCDERRSLWKLLDDLPVSVSFYRGPDLVVERAHPTLKRTFGRDVEGLPYREAFPELIDQPYLPRMEEVLRTGQPAYGDAVRVGKLVAGGEQRNSHWKYAYLPVMGPLGRVAGLISCHVDVTTAVEARETLEALTRRYAAFIEASAQTVWTSSVSGIIAEDSPTWRAFTGQSREEWLGRGWLLALHPDDRERVWNAWMQAIATQSPYDVEYRVHRTDGSWVWTVARAVPVRDASGAVCEWIGTNIDISSRKAAEEARALAEQERSALFGRESQMRAEAEQANRAKDEFLAMLGHELRNPLAPIVTALELMKLDGTHYHERERSVIERHVRHLGRLVDDLLDVSRITRGRVDLQKQRIALFDVVQRAVEMASPLLDERHHYLTVDVPKEGFDIDADSARMAQVVANLLTNAAKYTEPRGRIRITVVHADGGNVVLSVSDTGLGIAKDELAAIFEPFVQQPQSLARSHGGLGLGLAIVRSLVTLHGGTVSAHSQGEGKGSEFVITLPLAAQDVPAERAAPRSGSVRPGAPPGERRVLVVDDNEDAGSLLATWLDRHGYHARTAADGFEALTLVRTFRPQIALLDIGLPVLDGYELAERLLADPNLGGLKLVAVTGYGQDQDRKRSKQVGFHAHLVKPVDLDELTSVLLRLS